LVEQLQGAALTTHFLFGGLQGEVVEQELQKRKDSGILALLESTARGGNTRQASKRPAPGGPPKGPPPPKKPTPGPQPQQQQRKPAQQQASLPLMPTPLQGRRGKGKKKNTPPPKPGM